MALRPTLDLLAASPSRRLLLAVALPTVVALGSAALLVSSPSACAQPVPAAADAELIAAFKRFQQAGPNDHAAIDDAAERFAHLSAAHPTDPVLRAYAGASTSMRATTTLLPWRKMSYAEDGLALSSRNGYLDANERALAPVIYALLLATRERIAHGERNYPLIEAQAKVQLLEQGLRPDYFSIRCARTLEPASLSDTKLVILVAAWLGKTRLIDNVTINIDT